MLVSVRSGADEGKAFLAGEASTRISRLSRVSGAPTRSFAEKFQLAVLNWLILPRDDGKVYERNLVKAYLTNAYTQKLLQTP